LAKGISRYTSETIAFALTERCPAHRARFATPGDSYVLQICFLQICGRLAETGRLIDRPAWP
jgi:hypothetical protein